MRGLSGGLSLLLDPINDPGPGWARSPQYPRDIWQFLNPKSSNTDQSAALSATFFCARFSRNNARSSSYDPEFSAVLPTIFNAFFAALGTLAVLLRHTPCPQRQQIHRLRSSWLPYSVYLMQVDPRSKSASLWNYDLSKGPYSHFIAFLSLNHLSCKYLNIWYLSYISIVTYIQPHTYEIGRHAVNKNRLPYREAITYEAIQPARQRGNP
jgi:hypothetical protein